MSDSVLNAKSDELKRLQEQMVKLTEAQEKAAVDYTEARELLDGLRQSNANDQNLREANKNNPAAVKGYQEFDKMLANGIQLEKDRRHAAEKIAEDLGQTKRDIAKLETEIEQLKNERAVDSIKDDLDIDFDALKKQGESTDDLLQSTANTTQAHLESTVARQTSTIDRVQKDIDLCNNLQSKLQTERDALSSGVVNRVMNWRKISEIDKNLKEVTGKKTGREAMLKEAQAGLDEATKALEAHKKSFGVDDHAKAGNNVGTSAHISFHGHGDKQQQGAQVKLPNTGKSIDDLTQLVPKGPHVHR